jgi:hypothetical protein
MTMKNEIAGKIKFKYLIKIKIKIFLKNLFFDFSKIDLGHHGTLHALSKYEKLFRQYSKLTKLAKFNK